MKDKVVIVGSVLSAMAASVCCIGPLVFVALGIGGFTASALFEPWRPYLLGLTFGLLGLGFYLTYRRPKVVCADGSVCASSGTAAHRRNKILLWVATILVLVLAAFPYYSGPLSAAFHRVQSSAVEGAAGHAPAGPSETVAIKVSGMTCDGCAESIKLTLGKIPGVQSAAVSFEKGEAIVKYDATQATVRELTEAISQAGYKPSLLAK